MKKTKRKHRKKKHNKTIKNFYGGGARVRGLFSKLFTRSRATRAVEK